MEDGKEMRKNQESALVGAWCISPCPDGGEELVEASAAHHARFES